MAIVQSLQGLVDLSPGWAATGSAYGSMRLYDRFAYDYATLYRLQPNVRTCVDFLARNIAQLGLHVFRRAGDDSRERLREHPLANVLKRPLPPEYKVSRYRLIESLIADMGIYFNAYWLKLRAGGAFGLLRVPPPLMVVDGGLFPTRYQVTVGSVARDLDPGQVVHFRGYNPTLAFFGLSPLETLRRVLAEEEAMGDYREHYWLNSARMNGIIQRPAEAPEWSSTSRDRFKSEFEALYAGGANSGKTAILEEGMEWKETSFNAQESEYLGGRKLTREECARAYHIPLPMVGILDHATFSNIKEQHRNLYQDCLGPWLAMIEEDIGLQLAPDFESGGAGERGSGSVYVEFNIAEKLQGSFEEQTASVQGAVGRPWMTPDEARARFNMPAMGGDAGALGMPLNVTVATDTERISGSVDGVDGVDGDQEREGAKGSEGHEARRREDAKGRGVIARAITEVPKGAVIASAIGGGGSRGLAGRGAKARMNPTLGDVRERHVAKWGEVLRGYFTRQHAALVGRARDGADIETVWGAGVRWDGELGDDLFELSMATATVWAGYVGEQTGAEIDPGRMAHYVRGYADRKAAGINASTRSRVADVLTAVGVVVALKDLFDSLKQGWTTQVATGGVTAMANFGSHEGATQSGLQSKTWIHGGAREPRAQHVALDGETVGIGELFSNGMRWPGDPGAGPEETAYCHCSVEFGTE